MTRAMNEGLEGLVLKDVNVINFTDNLFWHYFLEYESRSKSESACVLFLYLFIFFFQFAEYI